MTKASDNVFPKVILDGVTSAPTAPSNDNWKVYAMVDGVYARSSNTIVGPFGSGGGSVATDAIWDAAGDLAVGSGANTAARLAIGSTNGMVVARVSGSVAWALPPGFELDYVEKTSGQTFTGTNEAGAVTVITGTSQSYAAEPIVIEVFMPRIDLGATNAATTVIDLYDGGTILGRIGTLKNPAGSASVLTSVRGAYRYTPSAATHQYIVKAWSTAGDGALDAGSGGTGTSLPAFLRVTKV